MVALAIIAIIAIIATKRLAADNALRNDSCAKGVFANEIRRDAR